MRGFVRDVRTDGRIVIASPAHVDSTALAALVSTAESARSVLSVKRARDAVRLAASFLCDLVVIDTQTSEQWGLTLLERLRGTDASFRTLVIVSHVRAQTEAQVIGADVALVTGYPSSDLILTVERLLIATEPNPHGRIT